jgi:E3 ubiquitin-protein ligase UBR3
LQHGQNTCRNRPGPPYELMCVAENMLPKMILRLLQHLREKSPPSDPAAAAGGNYKVTVEEADAFLGLLQDFCDMGTAMRNVIIRCLISGKIYTSLTSLPPPAESAVDSEYAAYMRRSAAKYEAALNALPAAAAPEQLSTNKYCECPTLTTARLVHTTFLEELLFWTVRYEFPQKLVCLLLIMLPDAQYKEVFTRAFVCHYWRMSTMLDKSGISDSLSNR